MLELGLDSARAEVTLQLGQLRSLVGLFSDYGQQRGNLFLGGKDLVVRRHDGGMWLLWLSLAREHHLAAEIKLTVDFVPDRIIVQELLVVINIDFLDGG